MRREVGQRRRGGGSGGWRRGRSAAPAAQPAREGRGLRPGLLWGRARAGARVSESELHPRRNKRQNSLLGRSHTPNLRLLPHDRRCCQHTCSLCISNNTFSASTARKAGQTRWISHTQKNYLRGGEEGSEKGAGIFADLLRRF